MSPEDIVSPISTPGLLSPQNELFVLARTGRLRLPQALLDDHPVLIDRVAYPLAALCFAIVVPILAALLGSPLSLLGLDVSEEQPDLGFALLLIGGFLGFFPLIWAWLRFVERRPLWTTGMTRPVVKPYLRGIVAGLLVFGCVVLILGLAGFLAVENTVHYRALMAAVAGTLLVFAGWIVQGAAEELLARGFLLPILGVRWGPLAAVLVSSLFFSLLHLGNPNLSPMGLLNLFLFGLFAAVYALYEGALWGIFAIHAIWNWAQGNLFGFSVSGMGLQTSILYDLMEVGPDWVTGGPFGPEGGIAVTVVLISAIAALWFLSRRASRTRQATS